LGRKHGIGRRVVPRPLPSTGRSHSPGNGGDRSRCCGSRATARPAGAWSLFVRLSAWRIVRKKRLATALTGQGASVYPGRWNGLGVPVVYTAGSISLAVLELLVHMESAPTTPEYRLIAIEFDESLVTAIDLRRLPRNWRRDPAPRPLQEVGNRWVRRGQSAVLKVPSSITGEPNYLLNPAHADFGKITVGRPTIFRLDARLLS